jgi:glutamyl-tRNA synthetase
MHIGTVRTALFNYLFAKHHGGTYFVRIEDTDKERNRPEWVDAIWRDFEWCGIIPDARYIQSQHLPRHRELLEGLVASDKAYISKEPAKDDASRTVEVVRLRNPGTSVTFTDLVRGEVTFDTTELGDFVIARSIADPLYHFAVVADDGDAGVTHVLRAEEHISNTPRQILIQEALGLPRPQYGHLPLILAPDRTKLSKRKHGATVNLYRDRGFLPEALINYLALLGWNPGTEQELFSSDGLIAAFDLAHVHHAGAIFDETKLTWFNREYLLRMPQASFERMAVERIQAARPAWDRDRIRTILPLIRERVSIVSDIDAMVSAHEIDFFFETPAIDPARLPDKKATVDETREHLQFVRSTIDHMQGSFDADSLKAELWAYATEKGRGAVLWPLRYALSGRDRSPDPFTIASLIGKADTLARIDAALSLIS